MFSEDGEVADARLDALVLEVDRFVSVASKTLRFGLRLLLFAIRWSPLLFIRLRPFDDLPVGLRVRHLERLDKSRVAGLALLVFSYKTLLTMLFYEDEEEQRRFGYPGTKRTRYLRLARLDENERG